MIKVRTVDNPELRAAVRKVFNDHMSPMAARETVINAVGNVLEVAFEVFIASESFAVGHGSPLIKESLLRLVDAMYDVAEEQVG